MTHHSIDRAILRDPTEDKIHRAAIQYLLFAAKPSVVFWHCPNGEARSDVTGAKLKALGVLRGVADICLVLHGGQAAFIEIKRRDGRQSKEQREFQRRVIEAGGLYAVCRSHEDITETLSAWGAIKGTARTALAAE